MGRFASIDLDIRKSWYYELFNVAVKFGSASAFTVAGVPAMSCWALGNCNGDSISHQDVLWLFGVWHFMVYLRRMVWVKEARGKSLYSIWRHKAILDLVFHSRSTRANPFSGPCTTNHDTVLLLANLSVLCFALRVRFIHKGLQIIAKSAPSEQALTVPQIFLAPVTLLGLSFAVELVAIPAGCWLLLRSDEQLTKLYGVELWGRFCHRR